MRRKTDANRIVIDLTPGPARDTLVQAANILTAKMHGVKLPWAQVIEILAAFYIEANDE